ncbi:MAG: hypothetical protein JOY60_12665 [Burkholderiaceae bacterium]|nr:hypothetical protein [Burkholderiaceae bacterium]
MNEASQKLRPEGIYRRLSVRMYGDEKFLRLSPAEPSGQSLWIYLLTGPHTAAIPGLFVIGRAALAENLGWCDEGFAKAFAEVFREGLCEFDQKSRLWFIPNAIKHNMPANPNVVRSWRESLSMLPECELRARAFEHIRAVLFSLSDSFGKAFDEASGKPSPKPLSKPSRKTSPKQEQKQKQEYISPHSHAGSDADEDSFAQFWAAYPRKVGKAQALKVFKKLGVNAALLAQIRQALGRQCRSEQWTKDGGQFIPHPTTWLNGNRWEDEVPVSGAAPEDIWAGSK